MLQPIVPEFPATRRTRYRGQSFDEIATVCQRADSRCRHRSHGFQRSKASACPTYPCSSNSSDAGSCANSSGRRRSTARAAKRPVSDVWASDVRGMRLLRIALAVLTLFMLYLLTA